MAKNLSKIRKIVKEYKEELSQHKIRVSKIILYGSYAKGNTKISQDVDLIIVSPDLAKYPPLKRQKLLAQLTMDIDAPLEVIGYTPEELDNSKDTIFGQIIQETGKVIL